MPRKMIQKFSRLSRSWPETGKNLSGSISEYFSARNEFSVVDATSVVGVH